MTAMSSNRQTEWGAENVRRPSAPLAQLVHFENAEGSIGVVAEVIPALVLELSMGAPLSFRPWLVPTPTQRMGRRAWRAIGGGSYAVTRMTRAWDKTPLSRLHDAGDVAETGWNGPMARSLAGNMEGMMLTLRSGRRAPGPFGDVVELTVSCNDKVSAPGNPGTFESPQVEPNGVVEVLHTIPKLNKPNFPYPEIKSNSPSATDMDDQAQDDIKRRPTSDFELFFKDDAGVTHKSNKFKGSIPTRWNLDIATLTVQRAVAALWSQYSPPHAKRRVKRAQTQHFTSPNPEVSWSEVGREDRQFGGRKGSSIVKTWTESESKDQDRRECIQFKQSQNLDIKDTPSLMNSPSSISISLRRRMTNITSMLYSRRGRGRPSSKAISHISGVTWPRSPSHRLHLQIFVLPAASGDAPALSPN
ncbi:hypothetical protein EDB85DRAFT_1895448 [Lactarius pseudohatsudake]|nr:hypothetical protein EDB85DRAFT_1895448 [Lactarius pseudohatsudake]